MQIVTGTLILGGAVFLALVGGGLYLALLIVRALRKYLQGTPDASEPPRTVSEAIKYHRTRCGMTQELVAARLEVSRQAVSKWESGQSQPSTANLTALGALFGVAPEELLGTKE